MCVNLRKPREESVDPMQIAIVDDEPEAIRSLKDPLLRIAAGKGLVLGVREYLSGREFLDAFSAGTFDIVFLDIYIDELSGLDLARDIRRADNGCMIVFVTTSRENMPEAFRFHAFDYIVKPISEERLATLFSEALAVLPTMNRYMTFSVNRQDVNLLFSDCVSAASSGHYLLIRAKNGEEYRTRMTLKEFTDMIGDDERFLSINKGIFVNMDHIQSITQRTCVMANGQHFPIKIRESQQIERTWQNYCFDQLRKGQKS